MKIVTISTDELKQLISEVVSQELKILIGNDFSDNKSDDKIYYTRDEVSKLLNVSFVTLHKWEKNKILVPVKIGKRVLYHRDVIHKKQNSIHLKKSPYGDFSILYYFKTQILGNIRGMGFNKKP